VADDARKCPIAIGFDSPLTDACRRGHLEIVRWLVDEVGLTVEDACAGYGAAHQRRHVSARRDEVCQFLAAKFGATARDHPECHRQTAEMIAQEFARALARGAPAEAARAGAIVDAAFAEADANAALAAAARADADN
jgi:hypothetical protein